ncbi:hypothetical protein HZC30_06710 [Candidatus Woesearchaeota archaeon]|nr:hypothetical protein [Candidatus Woesearchaeota archaeon]
MKKEVNGKKEEASTKTNITELLNKSEISLWLDNYNDIFSDFDPRPYAHRALSQDLLDEAKRATREAPSGIELRFLIPNPQRNLQHEFMIKKRLREHFRKHSARLEAEYKAIRKKGIIMAIIGMLLLTAATFLYQHDGNKWWTSFLIVLFEPAGWFTIWIGLEKAFAVYEGSEHKLNRLFYQKMAKAEFKFEGY